MPQTPSSPNQRSNPRPATSGVILKNRYRLDQAIAAGGMAQVWQGEDIALARPIAIKVLHPHLATDEGFVTRFRREALAAARLHHSSIVAVYDTVSDDGIEAIVMELIEGRTLRSVLDELGRLPPVDVVDIGKQISNALDVAHVAGIVHRDVKPANIMISSDRRILVTDFGIAKANKDSDLTQTGTLLGTAKYLAPEQVTGDRVDPRADIYSLAVVLFEAATGKPPFVASTDAATALARIHGAVPRCRTLQPDVPHDLDAAIYIAMARNPDERYSRVLHFRDALLTANLDPAAPGSGPSAGAVASGVAVNAPSSGQTTNRVPARAPAPQRSGLDLPRKAPAATAPVLDRSGRGALKSSRAESGIAKRAARLVGGLIILALIGVGGLLLLNSLDDGSGVEENPEAEEAFRDQEGNVEIVGATAFDPFGDDGGAENNSLLDRAFDGDVESNWQTATYRNRPDLGGLKPGVGIILELATSTSLNRLDLLTNTHNWSAEVYVGESFDIDNLGEPVAVVNEGEESQTIVSLDGAEGSQILIWVTQLGSTPTTEADRYRFELYEAVVR